MWCNFLKVTSLVSAYGDVVLCCSDPLQEWETCTPGCWACACTQPVAVGLLWEWSWLKRAIKPRAMPAFWASPHQWLIDTEIQSLSPSFLLRIILKVLFTFGILRGWLRPSLRLHCRWTSPSAQPCLFPFPSVVVDTRILGALPNKFSLLQTLTHSLVLRNLKPWQCYGAIWTLAAWLHRPYL